MLDHSEQSNSSSSVGPFGPLRLGCNRCCWYLISRKISKLKDSSGFLLVVPRLGRLGALGCGLDEE